MKAMIVALSVAATLALSTLVDGARAQSIGEDLASRLSPEQQRGYVLHLRARAAFDRQLAGYWSQVEERREVRRGKRAASQPFTAADYVREQPPKYDGPPLAPDVAKIIAALKPPAPEVPRPALADFLAAARKEFGFVPAATTEGLFKRRYAEEALAVGLSKEQVVGVYALETGGRGTFDMQAGIDPETKVGKPISTALGYAQLLSANSVNEIVKHADAFVRRLEALARVPGTTGRRKAELSAKIQVLRRMHRAARAVPNHWREHVRLGNLPKGHGIHTLNLDADIGPWLQVIKLKGVREEAEKAGRTRLSGPEIELMNLAGPRTGLEMMEPVGRTMPTSNFFAQGGYYRNTIVRDKTSAELLAAIAQRIEAGLKKPGAIAFARAFDEAARKPRGDAGVR